MKESRGARESSSISEYETSRLGFPVARTGGWRELPRHALSYENLPFFAPSMYVPTTLLFSVLRDLDLARLL
jgi:hypothetical protein